MIRDIKLSLSRLSNKKDAEIQRGFFKTGKGEYGEGDVFIGVRTPKLRNLVKQYRHAHISVPKRLLLSRIHDERLLALYMFVDLFQRSEDTVRKSIFDYYLKHTKYINNWDLVDISAHKIVGPWLFQRSRVPIRKMVKSKNMWDRRISIISTLHFIKNNDFDDTLKFSKSFLNDKEDLMHKATGWMLREVGKRDLKVEKQFLKQHYKIMPRTMLRYAIEKFPESTRKKYLNGKI